MSENEELLRDAFVDAKPTSEGWSRAMCPFCDLDGHVDTKASLALRLDNGWYQCWRCGSKGFAKSLVMEDEFGDRREPDPSSMAVRSTVSCTAVERTILPLPDGFTSIGDEPGLSALSYAHARNYLVERNVPQRVWREAGIGAVLHGYYGRRIIVPVTSDEECYGWVARSWGNADRKYLYPKGMKRSLLMFNQDALLADIDDPIVVVEGIFDALKLWPNAVAVLGKPARSHIAMLLESRRSIAVCLDADARDDSIALMMQLRLHSKPAAFVELPPGRDPGDLPATWLKAQVSKAMEDLL